MIARDIIQRAIVRSRDRNADEQAVAVAADLTAAGYRIVPPGGLDAASVERCIAEIDCGCERDHCPSPGFCAKDDVAALRSLIGGKT